MMNAEHVPFDSDADEPAAELGPALAELIMQIRRIPAPPENLTRLVKRASAWSTAGEPAAVVTADRAESTSAVSLAIAVAVAFVVVTAGSVAYWLWHQAPDGPALEQPQVASNQQGAAHSRGAGPAQQAGVSPSRHVAVSDHATVLVSTGGEKPIRLDDKQPYSKESFLHVWDWQKSDESRRLPVSIAGGMAVSPDGKAVVTSSGQLVDLPSGETKKLDHFDGHILGLKFSPDGRTLLLLVRGEGAVATARLLDFPLANKRFVIEGLWGHTFACAFTADSRQLALMDQDRFVRRFDALSGQELGRYEPAFVNSIRALALSPDGKCVAGVGSRKDGYLWELSSGKLLHTLTPEQQEGIKSVERVDALAFSPDGKLLAISGLPILGNRPPEQAVMVLETGSGKIAWLLASGPFGGAVHLRFSQDGSKLTAVHGFYGAQDAEGNAMLGYPHVRQWSMTADNKAMP